MLDSSGAVDSVTTGIIASLTLSIIHIYNFMTEINETCFRQLLLWSCVSYTFLTKSGCSSKLSGYNQGKDCWAVMRTVSYIVLYKSNILSTRTLISLTPLSEQVKVLHCTCLFYLGRFIFSKKIFSNIFHTTLLSPRKIYTVRKNLSHSLAKPGNL